MAAQLEQYAGREQSFIKHVFLTEYLRAAAYKTLQARSGTFNFVDAFAGPWRVSDNKEYSDASFHQALKTLDAVRTDLGGKVSRELKIRFCFCEKKKSSYDRLLEYAARQNKLQIHLFHGLFEDNLDKIAAKCSNGFTFTFIDPKGWNIRSGPILKFLRVLNGEFLLNFMAESVNRHAEYSSVAESFGRFLADPHWDADFRGLPTEWSNEHRVLHLLKRKIKSSKAATYLPDFPILAPLQQRTKMRLLLGTHSAKGLEVFRDVQGKVERREMETRTELRGRDTNQISFFAPEEIAALQQMNWGVGSTEYQREATNRIIKTLQNCKSISFREISIDVLEHVPIRLTQIKTLLNNMRNQGLVSFDLPARKRVPEPSTRISIA
ncbi:MAG: three-Cys-motif partner protein TcmP [Gammaproteobacteria bacterium]|nr:three-Cys-motif partner protein TcmP [Gammaproteobacteria bacterium]